MTPNRAPESYEILHPLGSGGWAEVYVARSRGVSDHLVALKLLRPDVQQRPDALQRFRREVEIGVHLNHPNIAAARAETKVRGRPALVLELVGPSVDAMREHIVGNFPVVRWIARQLFRALLQLEREGITHRDLSLGNLLIDPRGNIRLIDFGVATRDDGSVTPGPVGATWPYISPELCRGERGAPVSDVFSAGALLYELVSGSVPFGKDRVTVEHGHARGVPALHRSVPRDLRRVIRGALTPDTAARVRPLEALGLLADDDPRVANFLGALCLGSFRRQCRELTHPLESVVLHGSAAASTCERPVSRSWRMLTTATAAAVTAAVSVAIWTTLDDRDTGAVAGGTQSIATYEHRVSAAVDTPIGALPEPAPRPSRAVVRFPDATPKSDAVQAAPSGFDDHDHEVTSPPAKRKAGPRRAALATSQSEPWQMPATTSCASGSASSDGGAEALFCAIERFGEHTVGYGENARAWALLHNATRSGSDVTIGVAVGGNFHPVDVRAFHRGRPVVSRLVKRETGWELVLQGVVDGRHRLVLQGRTGWITISDLEVP